MTATTIPPTPPPIAYWTCPREGCSFSAINPLSHPCPLRVGYSRRRHARVRPYTLAVARHRHRVDVLLRVILRFRRRDERPGWRLHPGRPAVWARTDVSAVDGGAVTAPMPVVSVA